MRNNPESLRTQNRIQVNVFNNESGVKETNLATTYGFYNRYFSYLKNSKTQNEAFVKVSVEYFNIHQKFKYANFEHFKSNYHAM